MKLIEPNDFCPINEILTGDAIFIIPNFQRPYVWGEQQFKDLFNDLEKAQTRPENFHYLSAIHVLRLQADATKADWSNLIDEKNTDCQLLETENFNSFGKPFKIYAVVDGQQRLTTLFLLAHVLAKTQPNLQLLPKFFATLRSGIKIPRLIQSPTDDYLYMQQMLADYHAGKNSAIPNSAAQERLKNGLAWTIEWAKKEKGAINSLLVDGLKTSIIRLEVDYGLTSFLTLNDRGKSLTVLERLKSAILQAVFESEMGSVLANRVHATFGRIYKILDKLCHLGLFHKDEQGDQEMVQLFSCYLRLKTDADSIWQSGDTAYEKFFRPTLFDAKTDIPVTIANWLTAIEEIANGLDHLYHCLTDTSKTPSIFFSRSNSYLVDDYKAVFLSLGLQPHLFALLLKFRALTGQDWHIRYAVSTTYSTTLAKLIQDHIAKVRNEALTASAHTQVQTYLDDLEVKLKDIKPRYELSMLEAVERLQTLNWNLASRRNAGFIGSCNANLVETNSAASIVDSWFSWCNGYDFLFNVLTRWNDKNFRYLLREMERELGQNIHNNDDFELEHILPKTPDEEPSSEFMTIGGYTAFGYADKEEYKYQGVERSGNLTWLTESCNASLGNHLPDVKAAHYTSCNEHSRGGISGAAGIKITHDVGTDLQLIQKDYKSYKWFISARCAELALFSLGRFV